MPPVLCVSEKQTGRSSALLIASDKRHTKKSPDLLEILRENPGALLDDERLSVWPDQPPSVADLPDTEEGIAASIDETLREIEEKGTVWL